MNKKENGCKNALCCPDLLVKVLYRGVVVFECLQEILRYKSDP